MRVAVMGGTRFIGRAILEDLVAASHDVIIVHHGEHEPSDLPRVEHLHVPRRKLASVAADLDKFRPEALIGTSALSGQDAKEVLSTIAGDLRLVVLSSLDVYRAYSSLLRNETTEAVPLDEQSPVRSERYPFRGVHDGMDDCEKLDVEEAYLARGASICRLPMVYGEHDYQRREEFILRRVRAERKRIPIGAGSWLASRGYVRDMAAGVRLTMEDAAMGAIFNLSERRTWTIGQLIGLSRRRPSGPSQSRGGRSGPRPQPRPRPRRRRPRRLRPRPRLRRRPRLHQRQLRPRLPRLRPRPRPRLRRRLRPADPHRPLGRASRHGSRRPGLPAPRS